MKKNIDLRDNVLALFFANNNIIKNENDYYSIYTEKEANKEAKEYILKHAYNFDIDMLSKHISDKDFEKIESMLESDNEKILKVIKNKKAFVEHAIMLCGRGWFLSGYDGIEHCIEFEGVEYFIYKN